MTQKYYAEEIQKNTRYRTEYQDTIFEFLKCEKEKASKTRNAFFSPEKCKEEQENFRQQFIEMLGFPLNKEREIPALIEKVCNASSYVSI